MDSASNPYVAAAAQQPPPPAARAVPGNWVVALVSALAALGILGGIALFQHLESQRYVAEAVVQVLQTPPSVWEREPNEREYERYRHTQSNVITSDNVVSAALRRPEVSALPIVRRQSDPAAWLSDSLVVNMRPNSEYVYVQLDSASAGDPEQAAKLVNAVVSEYVDYANSMERIRRGHRLDTLRIQITKQREQMQQLHSQHQEMKNSAGDASPDVVMLGLRVDNQQRILDEFERELARCEPDFAAPPRVSLVQEAQPPAGD